MQTHPRNTGPVTLGIEMSNPGSTHANDPAHAIALWSGIDAHASELASMPMPSGTRGSDGIMSAVQMLCAQHGIAPGNIARIFVSIGPGGYTALRIATTTAKMLAYTLGAELIGVPSVRVASAALSPEDCPALVTLASKKERAHASVVHEPGTIEEIGIIGADQIAALGVKCIVADTHLPESFAKGGQALGIKRLDLRLDARHLLRASVGIDPIDPQRLAPIYAREPDAVTQWRVRGSG